MRLLFNAFLVTVVAINLVGSIQADVSSITSDRKINLEDIERDNLLNEIRSKSQETLHAEPTEHVPPSAAGPVQHVQHSGGPTSATPTASGGAVSHQTIVYHQGGSQHPQTYNHVQQAGPAPNQLHSGITYAQSAPQYSHSGPASAPAPTFHYSHQPPPHSAHYVQQPQIHSHPQVASHQPIVYYSHQAQYPQEPVQYVTLQPQQHYSHNLIAPQVPQVHEEGRTYSAPSRHTLEVATQQQKHFKSQPNRAPIGFRPKPALIQPQPQYVYVQANNVASAQQQRAYEQKLQQQQQQIQQQAPQAEKVHNVEIIQSQGQQIGPVEYVPQQSGVSYSQTTPYFQYSGAFGHQQNVPAHHSPVPVNNYVVVPYQTSPNVYHHQQAAPVQHHAALAHQQIVPEVPHYVHPTKSVIPSGPPQVVFQGPHHPQSYVSAAPHYHPAYPGVHYAPTHPGNSFNFGHAQNYNNYYQPQPSLDFFGPYARHTSLIDSYVPSNLIYSKSRQIYNQYYSHPQAPVAQGPPVAQHQIEPEHSPIYNTIAYSTEQKPVVVPPPSPAQQHAKRESTVLRASPLKPTTATKLDSIKFNKKP